MDCASFSNNRLEGREVDHEPSRGRGEALNSRLANVELGAGQEWPPGLLQSWHPLVLYRLWES